MPKRKTEPKSKRPKSSASDISLSRLQMSTPSQNPEIEEPDSPTAGPSTVGGTPSMMQVDQPQTSEELVQKITEEAEFWSSYATKYSKAGFKKSKLKLTETHLNGIEEFGISAGIDAPLTEFDRLAVPPPSVSSSINEKLVMAFSYLQWSPGTPHVAELDSIVRMIIQYNLHGLVEYNGTFLMEDADFVVRYDAELGPNFEEVAQRFQATNEILRDEARKMLLMTVALSTKVTWFLTNHHVGVGTASNFTKKIANMAFPDFQVHHEALLSAIHKIGHFISTKLVMSVWLKDDTVLIPQFVKNNSLVPRPSRDVMLRLKSFPAGTAKFGFTITAFARAALSPLSILMQLKSDPGEMRILNEEIMNSPLKFHIGSKYLVGSEPKTLTCFVEEDLALASAFVLITARETSLGRAKVLLPESEVASMLGQTYTNMQTMYRGMRMTKITSQDMAQIMAGSMVTTLENPFERLFPDSRMFQARDAKERGAKRMREPDSFEMSKRLRSIEPATEVIEEEALIKP